MCPMKSGVLQAVLEPGRRRTRLWPCEFHSLSSVRPPCHSAWLTNHVQAAGAGGVSSAWPVAHCTVACRLNDVDGGEPAGCSVCVSLAPAWLTSDDAGAGEGAPHFGMPYLDSNS